MNWLTLTINGNPIQVAFDENSIHVYNGYPIKDDLKLRGYHWNPAEKTWCIDPVDVDQEMEVLKNDLKPPVNPLNGAQSSLIQQFPESFSVIQLRNRIDQLLQQGLGGQVWIRGLIASDVKDYQWASYFDLKDEDEKSELFFRVEVRKNILSMMVRKLTSCGVAEHLEKDLPIFCLVQLKIASRYAADIRLHVLDILPEYTQAKIRNQREITLEQLQKEKVLENQKQLPLADLIFNIGLISSEQGTSVKDILAGLAPLQSKYQFYFMDTRMEGAQAVGSVIKAIDYLEAKAGSLNLDAIIIARGGGSEQSLAVFNDYKICRRVCDCKIPIFTAIGHEKDLSAIEICSHFTPIPATPSGLGKYFQDRYVKLQQHLADSTRQLIDLFGNRCIKEIERVRGCLNQSSALAQQLLKYQGQRLVLSISNLKQALLFLVKGKIDQLKESIKQLCSRGRGLLARDKNLLVKTSGNLDFVKRYRENLRQRQNVTQVLEHIKHLVFKQFNAQEQHLQSKKEIVLAWDPGRILRKGFTLTLDEQERIIKSLEEFKNTGLKKLRFHDGSIQIQGKEEHE